MIKQNSTNMIIRSITLNKKSIEIANDILNNKYYLIQALETIQFDKSIDWDYDHKKNSKSYQIYLHGLQPISFLMNAYELTDDVKYLNKSLEIIQSWLSYMASYQEVDGSMIWYDHTVAIRTTHLLHFLINAKDVIKFDYEAIYQQLTECIKYLCDDSNYTIHNHGIMMDKSLLMCSFVLEDEKSEQWYLKAMSRLKENFYCSFSNKGTHLENSTFYHKLAYRLFNEIEEYLNRNNKSFGEKIVSKLELIKNVSSYIIKPNLEYPQIGDSIKFKDENIIKYYDDFIDIEAGIGVIQQKNENNLKNSFWMSFKCGYGSTIHKHLDDLSITSYYNGSDILVDSGGFGYGNSKERSYVRSALAHNTITVKGEKYIFPSVYDAREKVSIIGYEKNCYYTLIKGINNLYKDIEIERNIVHFKENITVIIDKGKTNKKNKSVFVQNFNLSADLKVKKNSKEIFDIYKKDVNVEIKQYGSIDSSLIIKGDKNIPIAVLSETTGKTIDTNQIRFEVEGRRVQFITVISYDKDNTVSSIIYDNDGNQLYIKVNNINHIINI